jgi:hypothetical protein
MNTDPLHALWNSPSNVPTADAGQQLAAVFSARQRRSRQLQIWWLAWTFLALSSVTALAIVNLTENGASSLSGQWALWPLLALPWCAAIIFLRRFRREGSAPVDCSANLRSALRIALASNLSERRRLSVVGGLIVLTAPIAALAIRQLQEAGKATIDQAWSMAAVFGAGLALGGMFVLWRYWHVLVPESRRIDSLLRDMDAPNSPHSR